MVGLWWKSTAWTTFYCEPVPEVRVERRSTPRPGELLLSVGQWDGQTLPCTLCALWFLSALRCGRCSATVRGQLLSFLFLFVHIYRKRKWETSLHPPVLRCVLFPPAERQAAAWCVLMVQCYWGLRCSLQVRMLIVVCSQSLEIAGNMLPYASIFIYLPQKMCRNTESANSCFWPLFQPCFCFPNIPCIVLATISPHPSGCACSVLQQYSQQWAPHKGLAGFR